MIFKERKEFTFISKALSEDTFSVVKFKGVEAISRPYEFDITLASEDSEIDLKTVLQSPAKLIIKYGDAELPFHGILARFEQLHEVKQHAFYRALLVSKLWNAGLYHQNQLFLDKTVPQIIEEILKQAGLSGLDYELKLTRSYPTWEYICQYGETDLDFISRWMEREGIYYFFEQTEQGAKIVITDSSSAHQEIKTDKTVSYSPPSGLIPSEEVIVRNFVCRQRILPAKVILKDYNYRKPGLETKAEAEVDSNGRGNVYIYGEHFKDPGQGNELAKIRAEEFLCREREFFGDATAPAFSPGFIFELSRHYRNECNRRYLIVEVTHEGSRAEDFLAGLGEKPTEGEEEVSYSNRFACIPAEIQFRSERKTPRPKFYGTVNAKVDAAGDGQFAELDDQGRYKVILPFDLSGRSGGKASRYVRMAQPYSGFAATDGLKEPSGMHFPLHKSAEVLLTFIDGDPDRPIISSALPNPETTSPVTSENQTKSVIRDNYGNELVFDATPDDEHISLYSPHHRSGIQLGKSVFFESKSDSGALTAGFTTNVHGGGKSETVAGISSSMLFGFDASYKLSSGLESSLGPNSKVRIGPDFEFSKWDKIQVVDEDYLQLVQGNAIIESQGEKKSKLLLSAGQKRESVVEMDEQALCLSVGKGTKRTPQEMSREDHEHMMVGYVSWASTLHLANATAAIGNYLGLKFSKDWKESGANILQTSFSATCNAFTLPLSIAASIIALAMYRNQSKPENVKKKIEESAQNPEAKIELKKKGEVSVVSSADASILSSKNITLDASSGEIRVNSKSLKGKGPVELGNGALKILAPPPAPKPRRSGKPFGAVDALTGRDELSPASKEMLKRR